MSHLPPGLRISGTGSYLPARVITNHELETKVATTDEWIRTRTGICERRRAAPEEATSDLGAHAARAALAAAHLTAADIDLLIVATISPDLPFPNTACLVQEKIGAHKAVCFSVEAACSGFVYILEIGAAMLRNGIGRHALLIGAEKLSTIINWEDRNTAVLFGDGAGAVVLSTCPAAENTFLGSCLGADGAYAHILHTPGGGSRMPFSQEVLDKKLHFLQMAGPEVFRMAVTTMSTAAQQLLARTGVSIDQIRWLVPHQANTRIISAVAKRLHLPEARAYVNVQRTGNTSAATIPIALDELVRGNQVSHGDYLLFVAFGGGLTWGANLLRW